MTAVEFKVWFPEFTSTADATVSLWLTRADPWFDVTRWDSFYSEGLANWVAHQLTIAARQAAETAAGGVGPGDITSKSVGDVSVTRSAAIVERQASDPMLRTTYGQRYAELRDLVGIGAWTTGPTGITLST